MIVKKPIEAWHFLPLNGMTRAYEGSPPPIKIEPGMRLTHRGGLRPCVSGLHYSLRVVDALGYAPGPIVCRVLVGGKRVEGDDKGVARWREVVWMGDARPVIDRWLCSCLERMVGIAQENGRKVGQPELDAIDVQRRWLTGDATIEELISARDSAWDSARDSARDSAWASARASARASAWASARDSARDSAWDSEREWQNAELERLLTEAFAPAEAGVTP